VKVSILRPLGYGPNTLPLRQPATNKSILFFLTHYLYIIIIM
jgi:hypothetical protein